MAASPSTITGPGRRCPVHHVDQRFCPVPDPELSDTLAELQRDGVLIVDTPPRLLDLCDVFPTYCSEQAQVVVVTTERRKREIAVADGSTGDATFRSWHQSCVGCLPDAIRADHRGDFLVEVHVPANAIAVAA